MILLIINKVEVKIQMMPEGNINVELSQKLKHIMDRFMRAEPPGVFKTFPTNGTGKHLRGMYGRPVSC